MSTNEPMTREQLDAIASRAEAAERGPWEVTNGGDNETSTFIDGPDGDVLIRNMRGHGYLSEEYVWVEEPNAQFIAHARTDIPALLAEVERLRALTTVDDDMVKRAALAVYEEGEEPGARSWDNESEVIRGAYRQLAIAALEAALDTGEGS